MPVVTNCAKILSQNVHFYKMRRNYKMHVVTNLQKFCYKMLKCSHNNDFVTKLLLVTMSDCWGDPQVKSTEVSNMYLAVPNAHVPRSVWTDDYMVRSSLRRRSTGKAIKYLSWRSVSFGQEYWCERCVLNAVHINLDLFEQASCCRFGDKQHNYFMWR